MKLEEMEMKYGSPDGLTKIATFYGSVAGDPKKYFFCHVNVLNKEELERVGGNVAPNQTILPPEYEGHPSVLCTYEKTLTEVELNAKLGQEIKMGRVVFESTGPIGEEQLRFTLSDPAIEYGGCFFTQELDKLKEEVSELERTIIDSN